jgi:ribosomal protein L7Ae-like RNA K-turn-binding protein
MATEISKPLKLGDVAIIKTSSATVAKPERTTKLNQKTAATTTTAAANISSSHPRRKPDPTAFQAPEGTHAKLKKRPSRLKRMYRRTKAEAAVEHWLSVLSAIEEALQIVGELHGAIANETEALKQKENESFVAARTQEEEKSKNISFARALLVGTATTEERENTVFTPSAQLKVLHEQARKTSERVEQLASIHATARSNLMKSQEQLLSAQGGGGNGGGGRKGKTLLTIDALELKPSKDALVIEPPEVKEEARLPKELPPPPQTAPTLSPVHALPPPAGPSPALYSAKSSVDDLQQNGTQDVEIVGAQNENLENSSTSNSSSSTSSSDGSSSSSGSDFGLQWGDTLRTWATHVGVDAKQSLQKQQKRHHVQKQAKTKNEQLVEKKKGEPAGAAAAPAVATNTKTTTNKLDNAVSVPLPASDLPAIAAPPRAETGAAPPPSSTDAVRSWLREAESVDVPETLETSYSSDSSDEFNAVNEEQSDDTMPLSVTATATTTTINPAAASPPFHCSICNITASGLKPWEDHLASRRHASQVAKAANTATVRTQKTSYVVPRVHQSAGSSKCYIGPNADVEPYVTHIITPELNEATTALLKQLLEWQERTRRLDPVNFKRKRRLISGMREVEKSVKLNKAKLLIIAPNIGPVPAASVARIDDDNKEDGDDKNAASPSATTLLTCYPIQSALDMAKERGIPTVFALTRQRMGKILGARKTASAFVVLDVSGAEQLLAKVLELAR